MAEPAECSAPGPVRWRAAPAQEDLWIYEEIAGPSLAYAVLRSVDITGRLDVGALESALQRLASRHLVLRCAGGMLDEADGVWMEDTGTGPRLERAHEVPGDQDAAIARAVAGSVSLAQRPAWRAILLTWAPGSHTLVLLFHHALVDGSGAETAVADLIALYAAAIGEPGPPLPPVTGDFRSFAFAQRSAMAAPHPADLAYWRRQLSGLAPAAAVSSTSRAIHRICLPAMAGTMAERAAAAAGVTGFTVCLAAVVASLARHLGLDEVTLAVGTSRRAPSDPAVGMYVDVLLLRVPAPGQTAAALIPATFDALVAGMDHGDVPYQRIRRELASQFAGGETLPTSFSVTMHTVDAAARQLSDSVWRPHDTASAYSICPLHVAFQSSPRGLAMLVGHDPEIFDAGTALRIGQSIGRELGQLGPDRIAEPDCRA